MATQGTPGQFVLPMLEELRSTVHVRSQIRGQVREITLQVKELEIQP